MSTTKGAGSTVEGWDAVIEAVAKAQVAHVLLHSDVWDGESEAPATQEAAIEDRDPNALIWSLAPVGAEISLVAQPFEAKDGVAAILRWNDASTPE